MGKGDRTLFPERPGRCFAEKGPVPFSHTKGLPLGRPSANDLVGLEFDDAEVRLAVARPARQGHVLCGRRRPLPAGAVVSGQIVDATAAAEALREELAALGTRPRRACLVLGGERTVCRVEPLAVEDDPHARAACEERMRRYVMFGGRPVTVGHSLESSSDQENCAARLVSAATPDALVMRQVEIARRCGLTVVRAEPAMTAVVRALLAMGGWREPRFVLVAHGSGCEIGIVHQDGLGFCHRLRRPAGDTAGDGAWLIEALDQLQDYHLRHAKGRKPIEELLCCGPAGALERALERVGELGIRVTWLDPAAFPGAARFEGGGGGAAPERSTMAPAVAGALSQCTLAVGRGDLNLLPPAAKKRRHRLLAPCVVVPVLLTLAATGGLLAWDGLVRSRISRLADAIQNPTPEMLEMSRTVQQASLLAQRVEEGRRLLEGVRRRAVLEFLGELPQRLPPEAWLVRVEFAADGRCVVEGKAQSEDAVFALATSLRASPLVEEAKIERTASEREEGLILTRFRLDVVLAAAAAREARNG